jgi:hypothetical protein
MALAERYMNRAFSLPRILPFGSAVFAVFRTLCLNKLSGTSCLAQAFEQRLSGKT